MNFSEIELLKKLDYSPGNQQTLIDVGAHGGWFAKPFARSGWRVIAFEPEPENYKDLCANLKNFPDITCFQKAISNNSLQGVPFYTSSDHYGIHSLRPFHPTHRFTLSTDTVRLDEVLTSMGIDHVTVLKIDIEGADFLALKSVDFNRLHPEVVICEFMDARSEKTFDYTHHDMAAYMARLGYAAFVSEWAPFLEYARKNVPTTPHKFIQCAPYPLDHDPVWGNLIFIPAAKAETFKNILSSYLTSLKRWKRLKGICLFLKAHWLKEKIFMMKFWHRLLLLKNWFCVQGALSLSRKPPIIVYQMGRVGSQSMWNSLRSYAKAPVFHVHKMNPASIAKVFRDHADRHQLLRKNHAGAMLRKHIVAKQRRAMLVVLIREPISRNISAFFNKLFAGVGYKKNQGEKANPSIAELRYIFLETHNHAKPLIWFDVEMKGALGIDVYQYPFPKEKGYLSMEQDAFKMLIIKCELEDTYKERAISEFLGLDHFKLNRDNTAQDKTYGDLYKKFVETSHLPKDYVDTMCNSKYTKHFYTETEIQQIRSRWLGQQ